MRLLPRKYDTVLLISILTLLVISLVMVASIGVAESITLSLKIAAGLPNAVEIPYPDCSLKEIDCYFLLKRHVMRIVIGLFLMLLAWRTPFSWIKKMTPVFYGGGIVLLVYVLFAGNNSGTFAQQWITLPGLSFINSLQPSELMKLGLILYLSYFFAEKMRERDMDDIREGFAKLSILAGIPLMILVLQKDLGSTMIMALMAVSIYFVAGASWRHLIGGMAVGCLLFLIGFATVERVHNRVMALVKEPDANEKCEGACWQSKQASIAIGSGGFWGEGLTGGIQKFWLPQATDDFIFAASAEELGFVRTSLMVILFFIVVYRGYIIASQATSRFAMLTATGITTWIAAQTFINIMVNTALFPITGITLPFMSYGGSSMVATLLAIGILLNISGETPSHAYHPNGGWDRRTHSAQSRPRLRYR